ncbi:MAG TPA: hypothetical protein DEF42_18315 [Desulfosporosinus sp.]|nr:hypothetical protein [Desulfosporosinus sp.]
MKRQTKNWIVFTLALYTTMFILIPPKRGPKVAPFGFYLGFIHASILNYFTAKIYKLWKYPGDILLKGIPIFTCLSWVPIANIFAYFFPYRKNSIFKAGYILMFASATTAVQHIHGFIGMWESKKWRTMYTFPLAVFTHTIMTLFLPLFNLKNIRENH